MGITTRPATKADIVDIVAALLAVNRSLSAIRDSVVPVEKRDEVFKAMGPILERCELLLQRVDPGDQA